MSHQPLYTKYRPQQFNQVVEQDSTKQILSEELRTNNLKRVLLFTGGAGTGKTTTARIYAKTIESVNSNIIEVNCADKTGVDDIRGLILDSVKSRPMQGSYKVFILDECHMLTVQAQNALLKILEEPPTYCMFILCTTDPQKVLGTILSRAFRYDFQLISHQGIVNQLLFILNSEKMDENGCGVQSWNLDAINFIAQTASGHMRNAVALLDKVISYSKDITVDAVVKVLGVTGYDKLFETLNAILSGNQSRLITVLDEVDKSGIDLKLYVKNFLSFVLDINKYIILKSEGNNSAIQMLSIPSSYEESLKAYTIQHKDKIKSLLNTLLELNSSLKWETNVKPVLESNLLLEIL